MGPGIVQHLHPRRIAGEIIADSYAFVIDPSSPHGAYPLEIGMYLLETATRLPIVDADGQLHAASDTRRTGGAKVAG